MKKIIPSFLLIYLISPVALASYPWLSTLDPTINYMDGGKRLMDLEYGLYPLEKTNNEENILLIGVHGSESRGYEWVYPLTSLDNQKTLTHFYRWDDESCYQSSAIRLNTAIKSLVKEQVNIKKIVILGHSYGGILLTWFLENWSHHLPIEIHTVASPLGGMGNMNNICNYKTPKKIIENVRSVQWRTNKELDGMFKNLMFDPQIINLTSHEVRNLPVEYKGKRLGHNWSISYVADKISF